MTLVDEQISKIRKQFEAGFKVSRTSQQMIENVDTIIFYFPTNEPISEYQIAVPNCKCVQNFMSSEEFLINRT